MKINVEVNSLVKSPFSGKFIKDVACAVIKGELKDKLYDREIELSIALVSPQKIRQINKKYRKIDGATDVLSFGEVSTADVALPFGSKENRGMLPRASNFGNGMSELIISPRVVESDAKKSKVSVRLGMAWVIIHGVLHLFGYDHEKNEAEAFLMREKEGIYLSNIFKIK